MNLLQFELPRPATYYYVEIPGPPQGWKRVATGKYGQKFNASRKAQDAIAWAVRAAAPGIRCDNGDHVWGMRAIFYVGPRNRTDVDNLSKNVLDALQGIVWKNDWQIRESYGLRLQTTLAHARTELLIYPCLTYCRPLVLK